MGRRHSAGVQSPQTHRPQRRQWCRRRAKLNSRSQPKQWLDVSSRTQSSSRDVWTLAASSSVVIYGQRMRAAGSIVS